MAAQRDEHGRFVKGHTGNPKGRMPKERETKYYELTMAAVSESDWVEIVNAAVKQAKRGDTQARKWLSDCLIGLPVQRTENTVMFNKPLVVKWDDAENND